jgi:ATP-dependent DNA ligase
LYIGEIGGVTMIRRATMSQLCKPISPMLCQPSQPFDDDDYSFEVKFDGERAILFFENGKVFIQNRKGNDITFRYPELQQLANGRRAILDGEIVVFDSLGKSDFNLLEQRSHLENRFDISLRMKTYPVTYVTFDTLSFDNEDLTNQPLSNRREILYKQFTPIVGVFQWSLPLDKEGRGKALFEDAKRLGLEGIVGKKIDSPYMIDRRSPFWKKCKIEKTVDMVFTKYTVNNAGIRVENEAGIAVQVSGYHAPAVKKEVDEKGSVLIEVIHRTVGSDRTKNGKLRMPTFKTMK